MLLRAACAICIQEVMMKGFFAAIIVGSSMLGLAACGTSTGERALSGGAIGAGAGAVAGAVTGMSVATGALLGGAVGAAAGALTRPDQVDLGDPIWE
jgi:hypothetical protein